MTETDQNPTVVNVEPPAAGDNPPARQAAGGEQAAGAAPVAPPRQDVGIRRVRMTISRVDPLSALKLSFLISVGIGIMIVISAIILWFVLDAMHVWARIENLLVTLNSEPLLELGQFMEFGRVVSFAVVVGVIEVVLLTLFGTVMALLYNVVAMLVGGLYITVTDE
ncbi:DUF3566 domain-containing protein [Trueperella bialowiezensis]|uniref:Transmembrane domain of uncharacterized function (DUF3566) n=1 Tax=Trueperella bialowiezensis TaxID=312285 RepID=A0A3S4WGG2_9ACTO|nr:DUF3566 domain-containing protein [Trueperella bialowiezensis]VEI13353.1 Transmembrane domain of uncharacterised function (DUF3566) [Trueperella bialowiezensis]